MLVKICGLTDISEADYLNKNNVDYAGFVLFFEKSKRCVTTEKAKEIFLNLNINIKKVAVVVSPSKEQIEEIENAGFDIIQVHGSDCETLKYIRENTDLGIFKAFNIDDMDIFDKVFPLVDGLLFDGKNPGSGETFDWNILDDFKKRIEGSGKLFILAGGLNRENVNMAVKRVNPDGVDVSSGVEKQGGGKDPVLVDEFVKEARR